MKFRAMGSERVSTAGGCREVVLVVTQRHVNVSSVQQTVGAVSSAACWRLSPAKLSPCSFEASGALLLQPTAHASPRAVIHPVCP